MDAKYKHIINFMVEGKDGVNGEQQYSYRYIEVEYDSISQILPYNVYIQIKKELTLACKKYAFDRIRIRPIGHIVTSLNNDEVFSLDNVRFATI